MSTDTTHCFAEDELMPISALQHFIFCERQCALIHIERQWSDNPLTLEGSHLHRKVDDTGPRREVRGEIAILRGLALRSKRLGLVGRADVVELHRCKQTEESGVTISGLAGKWIPYPIDYKRGKPKYDRCDEIQLCAQALCLEEMLATQVGEGALFYGKKQRRQVTAFDTALRALTEKTASKMRRLFSRKTTPKAQKSPKCNNCSLVEICLPQSMSDGRSAKRYIRRNIEAVKTVGGEKR